MSDRGTEALKKILGDNQITERFKPPTEKTSPPAPPIEPPPRLSELKKTVSQMGFVFIDGKLHNVIIDETAPAMETHPPTPQEDPKKGTSADYIKPEIYEAIKKAVLAGMNPVIFGPAGSGKSRLCKELAQDLGKPFHTMSFSGGLRYSQVFGSQELADGNTRWRPAPLLQWIQEPCLILLDEIFSADPEVLLGLNSLLEPDTRNISTPAGLFNVNPQCSFIACSNSNGRQQMRQYTGTTRTDDSLLDRLIPPFFMNYDPKAEKAIIKNLVDDSAAETLTATLEKFRRMIRENQIPFDPSTRRLIGACKLVKAGFPAMDAFKMSFTATLSPSELSKIHL